MRTSVRLYRTADGELVGEGDVDGVVLAYGQNDEVENADKAAAEELQPKKDEEPDEDGEKVEAEHTPKARARSTRKRAASKRAESKPADDKPADDSEKK